MSESFNKQCCTFSLYALQLEWTEEENGMKTQHSFMTSVSYNAFYWYWHMKRFSFGYISEPWSVESVSFDPSQSSGAQTEELFNQFFPPESSGYIRKLRADEIVSEDFGEQQFGYFRATGVLVTMAADEYDLWIYAVDEDFDVHYAH